MCTLEEKKIHCSLPTADHCHFCLAKGTAKKDDFLGEDSCGKRNPARSDALTSALRMVEHEQGTLVSSPAVSSAQRCSPPRSAPLEVREPNHPRWVKPLRVSYLLLWSLLRYKNTCLAPTPVRCSVVRWGEIMDFFRQKITGYGLCENFSTTAAAVFR